MVPDPSIWYQKTPGGPWYKFGQSSTETYRIRVCVGCGDEALMVRRQRFCSRSCRNRSLFVGPGNSRYTHSPTYWGRHDRVRSARGPAKAQVCADCALQAAEWSQVHGTSGLDVNEHYKPRCVPCHRRYDIGNRPRGESHAKSKLTDAQRRGIKASVGATARELAVYFGVSIRTIFEVKKNWKG